MSTTPQLRVLVTGAGGFIGSHLSKFLSQSGHQLIRVVRRSDTDPTRDDRVIETDMRRPGWTRDLPKTRQDTIIHLAQSREYRDFPGSASIVAQVNVAATAELAQWAVSNGVKQFLFASSGTVYPSSDRAHRETDTCAPTNYYGASKLAAEHLLLPFQSSLRVSILRLFGVYGPGQVNALIPNIVRRLCQGTPITLAGGIGLRINPIYVEDCSNVFSRLLMNEPEPGRDILNVAGDEIVDLPRMVRQLEALVGRKANLTPAGSEPLFLVGSTSQLKRQMNFVPKVTLDQGLRITVGSMRSDLSK